MTSSIPSETREQMWLIKWSQQPHIRKVYPELKLMYHIPNERSDKRQASILKKMGVKKGVPDVCLPVARGGYHGIYIEMKREDGGKTSTEQSWWGGQLKRQGYAHFICNGYLSASEVLLWYLNLQA